VKIYLVTVGDAEGSYTESAHRTYKGALKKWNRVRLRLIRSCKRLLKSHEKEYGWVEEMYQRMIKNLSCTDPKRVDNYPHETPRILSMKLEE